MYSNDIVNFQESTTIFNTCTKKSLETYWIHHVYACTNIITQIYTFIYIFSIYNLGGFTIINIIFLFFLLLLLEGLGLL